MNLSLGIVGLPNVGKSTLFNALSKQQVLAANYPFATIDPNHGVVPVHDNRLTKIAEVEKPQKVTPAVVEFVDIAGLVKGASKGEGLGNQFLANIREVSAIVHLVRAFEDQNITHVENSVDPRRDIELINTELILKDLETLSKKLGLLESQARSNPKLKPSYDYVLGLQNHLEQEKLALSYPHSTNEDVMSIRKDLFLLTDKPVIYLVNTTDSIKDESVLKVKELVGNNFEVMGLDVKQESELASMDDLERLEFMKELGINKTGLDALTELAYKSLGLISYFTSGPSESRAWTIEKGTKAPAAAGVIHGDFEKMFIAADVVSWDDFVDLGGWLKAKEKGKVRLEGKNYEVKDGDVMLFKHNA